MQNKLGIVIPLKARVVSRDWKAVCDLLEQTLRSVSSQSSITFEALVVGHDRPDIEFHGVDFHTLEIPIPSVVENGNYQNRADFDRILDKNRKIVRGMQLLQNREITHWFYLDADDLVDKRLVETVVRLSPSSGCLLDKGYLYYPRRRRTVSCDHLSQLCGSTSVLADRVACVPDSLDDERLKEVPWCRYPHFRMNHFFEQELGEVCLRVKEPLVAYVLDHGDNCSDEFRTNPWAAMKSWFKPIIMGRKADQEFQENFSIGVLG